MIKATAKVWLTRDGSRLVPDGSADAAVLFARKGQDVREVQVARFANAADFFAGLEKPKSEEPKAPPVTEEREPEKPKEARRK